MGTESETTRGLHDKVALVTGAGAGIGAAIARELAERGALVAVNYRSNREQAEAVVNEITGVGGKAIAVQADVHQPDAVTAMLGEIERELGPIDTLVLCAAPPAFWSRFVDQKYAAFEEKLLAETRGFFYPRTTGCPRHGNPGPRQHCWYQQRAGAQAYRGVHHPCGS